MRVKKRKSSVVLKNQGLGHFLSKDKLFIRNSRFNERRMEKAAVLLRALIGVGLVAVLVAVFVFVFVFLIPYLQAKVSGEQEEADSVGISEVVSYEPEASYDSKGLPIYENDVSLKLINFNHPAEQTDAPELETVGGADVNKKMALALKTLIGAAKEDGYAVAFAGGYVSYEEQAEKYEAKVEELRGTGQTLVMARTNAKKEVPEPGQSDFQTGLCVRLEGDGESFPASQTYAWLEKHMADYGFVFRFPDNKSEYTGLAADYTVIRYVGQENAVAMRRLSMCLEEYVSYLANQRS